MNALLDKDNYKITLKIHSKFIDDYLKLFYKSLYDSIYIDLYITKNTIGNDVIEYIYNEYNKILQALLKDKNIEEYILIYNDKILDTNERLNKYIDITGLNNDNKNIILFTIDEIYYKNLEKTYELL
jgi:hypothetical protein